jgi:hypothetical protein
MQSADFEALVRSIFPQGYTNAMLKSKSKFTHFLAFSWKKFKIWILQPDGTLRIGRTCVPSWGFLVIWQNASQSISAIPLYGCNFAKCPHRDEDDRPKDTFLIPKFQEKKVFEQKNHDEFFLNSYISEEDLKTIGFGSVFWKRQTIIVFPIKDK